MRRLGSGLLAVGLSFGVHVLAAAPAHAATPSVQWNTPAANGVQPFNNFDFSATVRTSSGTLTRNITVTFTGPAGRTPPDIVRTPGNVNSFTVTQAVSFPWNGAYGVNLTASAKDGVLDSENGDRTFPNSFTVDAPPVAPSGVTATADGKTRVVTVSWPANTEPDMVGYEVQKQSSSGAWTTFAVTDRTAVTDESTANKGGTYRYQVRALRQSAQAGRLNPSLFSSPAAATVPAPPPQTTPTTQPPTGGDPDDDDDPTTTETGGGAGGGVGSGGTEAGRGSGGTSGGGGRSSAGPALASTGKVDLSDFAALLAQQRGQAAADGSAGEATDDGAYEDTLPFKARTGAGEAGEDEGEALGEEPASGGNDNPQALGFLAGGLLATVLAMHVLWVRSEVHRAEALEALIPVEVEVPARTRRRRPSPAPEA